MNVCHPKAPLLCIEHANPQFYLLFPHKKLFLSFSSVFFLYDILLLPGFAACLHVCACLILLGWFEDLDHSCSHMARIRSYISETNMFAAACLWSPKLQTDNHESHSDINGQHFGSTFIYKIYTRFLSHLYFTPPKIALCKRCMVVMFDVFY